MLLLFFRCKYIYCYIGYGCDLHGWLLLLYILCTLCNFYPIVGRGDQPKKQLSYLEKLK